MHAESGIIQFNASSDLGGEFQSDTGAAIYFGGGSYTFSNAANFEGPGTVEITGGSVTLVGPLASYDNYGATVSGLEQVRGTINFYAGNIVDGNNVQGVLKWYGGALNGGASLIIASNAILNIEGSIGILGRLTNAGTVNWQAGEVSAFTVPSYGYNGEIWNETNALWDIQCDQTLDNQSPKHGGITPIFHNAGMLQKSATTGTTSFNIYLDNNGIQNS